VRVVSRVLKALDGLSEVDQRGVMGVVGLARGEQASAIRQVLQILKGVMASEDRRKIVAMAAAAVASDEEVVAGTAMQRTIGAAMNGETAEA
jgi:hypothetical protein